MSRCVSYAPPAGWSRPPARGSPARVLGVARLNRPRRRWRFQSVQGANARRRESRAASSGSRASSPTRGDRGARRTGGRGAVLWVRETRSEERDPGRVKAGPHDPVSHSASVLTAARLAWARRCPLRHWGGSRASVPSRRWARVGMPLSRDDVTPAKVCHPFCDVAPREAIARAGEGPTSRGKGLVDHPRGVATSASAESPASVPNRRWTSVAATRSAMMPHLRRCVIISPGLPRPKPPLGLGEGPASWV